MLLAQHNTVKAVDIVLEKVDLINNKKSPIQDDYIEKYLAEKELDLEATLDAEYAYRDADFVVIAAHTFAELLREGAIKEDIEILFMGFTEAEAVKLFANT